MSVSTERRPTLVQAATFKAIQTCGECSCPLPEMAPGQGGAGFRGIYSFAIHAPEERDVLKVPKALFVGVLRASSACAMRHFEMQIIV